MPKSFVTRKESQCLFCKCGHVIRKCQSFLNTTLSERRAFVQKCKLCFNCLRLNHISGSCPSDSSCTKCQHRHHMFLNQHQSKAAETSGDKGSRSRSGSQLSNSLHHKGAILRQKRVQTQTTNPGICVSLKN